MNRPEVRASNVVAMLEARVRTLEDALRPFAEQAIRYHRRHPNPSIIGQPECHNCVDPWPCKYETARRALEGER